jgi:hypothetical protein
MYCMGYEMQAIRTSTSGSGFGSHTRAGEAGGTRVHGVGAHAGDGVCVRRGSDLVTAAPVDEGCGRGGGNARSDHRPDKQGLVAFGGGAVPGAGRGGPDVGGGIRRGRGADSGADATTAAEHVVLGHHADVGEEAVAEVLEECLDNRLGELVASLYCRVEYCECLV